jgi:hypothetical protein
MSQATRGGLSLAAKSSKDEAAAAPVSLANFSLDSARLEKTVTSWPPRINRRTMFPPILPTPIIPSCILGSPFLMTAPATKGQRVPFRLSSSFSLRRTFGISGGAGRRPLHAFVGRYEPEKAVVCLDHRR